MTNLGTETTDFIRHTSDGGVTRLTLHAPPVNVLTRAVLAALRAQIGRAHV